MIPKSKEPSLSIQPVTHSIHLSLVIPFAPRTTSKGCIEAKLKAILEQAKTELDNHSPRSLNKPLLKKLEEVFHRLDYYTSSKSLYISLSPFSEKVYYLNIPVKESVVVDETFSLHDVVRLKKEEKNYLVLVINKKEASIYQGNNEKLTLLVYNQNRNLQSNGDEEDAAANFLKKVSTSLNIILKAYSLPVVAIGSSEDLALYHQITDAKFMAEVAVTEKPEDPSSVLQVLTPFLSTWKKLKENYLLVKLEECLQRGKLEVGIKDVWLAAKERKPVLLVVEEGFSFPSYLGKQNEFIYADAIPLNSSVQVSDAVADAVAKVLISGGDVEVVPKGMLDDFLHIALILA